jgi:hypothetical protein
MSLRKLLLEDLWLKLFALLVAVWIYASVRDHQGRVEEKPFPGLPVLVLSTASQVGDVRIVPDRVDVILRGDSRTLGRLLARDVHPVVDLTLPSALAQGHHRIVVSAPPGFTAVEVSPSYVEIIQLPPAAR